MNKNYEKANIIMEGAELLYSMLGELITGIRNLPGCRVTSNLKKTALETETASGGIFDTMKIVMTTDEPCMECSEENEQDMTEADIPVQSDLKEFLSQVSELIASDNPVSISADISIRADSPSFNGSAGDCTPTEKSKKNLLIKKAKDHLAFSCINEAKPDKTDSKSEDTE